jgi:DNA invertase Pin-like site-specific DNA recombinase
MASPTSAPVKSVSVLPVEKLVAVSYSRVSTGKQSAEDRSGLERQGQAIAAWLKVHPEYELDREIRHVGSGAKAGRFEWFIEELQQGRLPQGTCLVVEKLSRFSRESVTDVLETLIRLFRAGGAIAACELGGEVLSNFDGQNGSVFMLVGAIQRARGEWEERRDRKLGSDRMKRRLIAEGAKPFRSRQKGASKAMYPFWLNFDIKAGTFELNDHATWVKQVFLLAQEVGSTTIARRLKQQGIKCPTDRRKAIAAQRVVNLLKDRAVLGERQHVDAKGKPVGDPVPGVYPPLVTTDEWRLARQAVEKRHSGQVSTGSKRHNLFEGRIFCPHCCGRIGLYRSKVTLADDTVKHYPYLRCMTHEKDRDACPATRHPYDELRLLERLHSFRWAEYFSDAKHEAGLAEARKHLLEAQGARANAERELGNLRSVAVQEAKTGGTISYWLEDEATKLEAAYTDAQVAENSARSALDALQRRRNGKDAQRAIQKRVEAFVAADREDLGTRHEFNRWLYAEGLVLVVDLIRDTVDMGTGSVTQEGQILEIDQRLEDAAAFGMDVEGFREFIEARDCAIEAQGVNCRSNQTRSETTSRKV